MSTLPSTEISVASSNERAGLHAVGDLLDALVAIRIDVGHSANGIAASPALGLEQMREVRALLDYAIASAKEIFNSIHFSLASDPDPLFVELSSPARPGSFTDPYGRSRSNSALTT